MLALEPASIAVSLRVTADLRQQREDAEGRWQQRLERASYEVDRAARQYHAVEPENRLVARNLELAWEEGSELNATCKSNMNDSNVNNQEY